MKTPKIYLILVVAFVVRAILAYLEHSNWFKTDTIDYFHMADAIRHHHPYSFFPNGYPLLIAALECVLPQQLVPVAVIISNVIFSTAVVGMVYFLTKRMTGKESAALVAGIITTFYPEQLNYTCQLMSDCPASFFLILSTVYLVSDRTLAAGWWLYIASTFRATLLPIGPMLLLAGIIFRRPQIELLNLTVGIILGWLIFFGFERSGLIKPSTNLNANLLIAIKSDSQHIDYSPNHASEKELKSAPRTYMQFAYMHPKKFFTQRLIALWELWSPLPAEGLDNSNPSMHSHRGLIFRVLIGFRFPLFLLGCCGGWIRRREFTTWVLLVPILVITIVHVMTFSTPRYTLPIEPLLIVLAVTACFERLSKSQHSAFSKALTQQSKAHIAGR